ncbi:MAG: hypothetical protein OET90_01340, partial [Desulfuromonadales bacterium]|nr:hypothetical protein [Desulfuromonadales bacterium]
MGEILDGLTGKEIIDLYLSRLKRDKAEMDAKVSSMKKDRDIIDKFTLSEASIYTGDDFMKTPRFKFSATNGCDAGIKKATFYISVVEKDSGGVVKDDFVEFVFNDPISVGESAGYSNALGFVEWSPYFRMADESGVTLLVYPVKLVAEEGVVLADTMSLPAAQKRLAFIDRRLN